MANFHGRYEYDFAIMLGDNLYGTDSPGNFVKKFEAPYKPLLDAGVKFYAAIGNHDDPAAQINYKPFNMNGERYYSFKPSPLANARFFALDSNYMDPRQVEWLEKELGSSGSDWKIGFFHHPLYSSGDKHGPNEILRDQIEPLFVKHKVNVVFTGHEHFYERVKPQKGVQYVIAGSPAKLRRGDHPSSLSERVFDDGYTFMLVEIDGDTMHFQAITEKGMTVDYGTILKGTDNSVVGTAQAAKRSLASGGSSQSRTKACCTASRARSKSPSKRTA
jgi:predicted phosphodiesterase